MWVRLAVMDWLDGLVQSGRIADVLLAVLAFEAGALLAYRAVTKRGFPPSHILSNALAGVFLVLALRAALTSAGPLAIAACLAGAGTAHVVDLVVRWPRSKHLPLQKGEDAAS